jgi:small subunit ribosomal protein S21|tara:strand:- start:148 stop:378 length:231 start_codon:yes stop_codon:yes gene_type:complete
MANEYKIRQRGLRVEVKNDNITRAWRKLKKLLQDEGVTQELRDRRFYEKPSEKRNRKKAMAIKRWEKKRQKIEENF